MPFSICSCVIVTRELSDLEYFISFFLESVSQVRTPNAKCIAQEHWEDLCLSLKNSCVESRKTDATGTFSYPDEGRLFAMLLKSGKRKLFCFSQTCTCNFTRRKVSSLKRNTLRSIHRKYLSFHPRQRNCAEMNDVIVWYQWIMVLSCKPLLGR